MKIEVTCYGAMREYLPPGTEGNRAELEVPAGATVADVVDELRAPPGLVHMVLVNEVPSRLDRSLEERDGITLMPQFTGGC